MAVPLSTPGAPSAAHGDGVATPSPGERGRAGPSTARRGEASPTTAWLDMARIAAIIAVVLIHTVSPVVGTGYTDLGSDSWWVANALDSALRWCVPVFIMISGALLLHPRPEGVRRFYRRRFSRIGIPLLVWTATYLTWNVTVRGTTSPGEAVEEVLLGKPGLQLYFLFILAGLYLLTPFLRVLTEHADQRMLWGLAGLAVAFGAADQVLTSLEGVGEANAVTRFMPYVGFYVLGYLLRDVDLSPRRLWGMGALFIASVLATALGAGAVATGAGDWGGEARYVYDYLSPTVIAMSVAAFLLLRAFGTRWRTIVGEHASVARRRLRSLADLTFGVFLLHVLVLLPLRDMTGLPDYAMGMIAMAMTHAAVVLVVSLVATAALKRIPYLRATV